MNEKYTYKEVLLSLRSEYLNLQSKLKELESCVSDDCYFSVIKGSTPEIVINREVKKLFRKVTLSSLMAHDNHFRYYPVNMDINVSNQFKFAKIVKNIMEINFIYYNINKLIYSFDGSYILPNPSSFILQTPKFEVNYLGYKDAFLITSLKDYYFTIEDFERILSLEFLASDFPLFYQNLFNNNFVDMDINFDSSYVPSNKNLLEITTDKTLKLKKGH